MKVPEEYVNDKIYRLLSETGCTKKYGRAFKCSKTLCRSMVLKNHAVLHAHYCPESDGLEQLRIFFSDKVNYLIKLII